jgi:hypothetical protein
MKGWIKNLLKRDSGIVAGNAEWALEQSCASRLIKALTFIVMMLCLGVWIASFTFLKDRLSTETFTVNTLTNLTCISFFGGLAVAIFIGALAGNILRRLFWRLLNKRMK